MPRVPQPPPTEGVVQGCQDWPDRGGSQFPRERKYALRGMAKSSSLNPVLGLESWRVMDESLAGGKANFFIYVLIRTHTAAHTVVAR